MSDYRSDPVAFREAVAAQLASQLVRERAFVWEPDAALARFELDELASSFVWACVVATVDPMLYPHLVAVSGVDGRRGLTPSAYAALTGLDEREATRLAYWLAGDPRIVRLGLLIRDANDLLPSATPYRAAHRLVAHVFGGVREPSAGTAIPQLRRARHDDVQRTALAAVDDGLARGALVVIEGARGTGC